MTNTTRFSSAADYHDWVTMVAQNAMTVSESPSPTTVADHLIVDVATLTPSDTTLTLAAEPYVDDPTTQTRVYPKDVIAMQSADDLPAQAGSYRDVAVHLLAQDLAAAFHNQDHADTDP